MSVTTSTALGALIEKNKGLAITSYTSSNDFIVDLTSKLPAGDNVVHVMKAAHTGGALSIDMSNISTNPSFVTVISNPGDWNFVSFTGLGGLVTIDVVDSINYITIGQLITFSSYPIPIYGSNFTAICVSHNSSELTVNFVTFPSVDVSTYQMTGNKVIPNLTDFINIPIRIVNDNASVTPGQRDGDILTITAAAGKVFVIENGESATLIQYSSGNWFIIDSILPPVNSLG